MLELETLGVLVREERARIPPSLGRVSTGYGEGSEAPSVVVRLVNKGRSSRTARGTNGVAAYQRFPAKTAILVSSVCG